MGWLKQTTTVLVEYDLRVEEAKPSFVYGICFWHMLFPVLVEKAWKRSNRFTLCQLETPPIAGPEATADPEIIAA